MAKNRQGNLSQPMAIFCLLPPTLPPPAIPTLDGSAEDGSTEAGVDAQNAVAAEHC